MLQSVTTAIIILSITLVHGDTCGRRLVDHEALIVNGYESKEGDWPWHASILHVAIDQNIQYKCGGTLLNSNSILTAAHCVYENGRPIVADRVVVQLGRHNLKISGPYSQEFEAYQTFPHHSFNATSLSNDIAIIRLATEVSFNIYVQPICLWDSFQSDVVGKYGTVVGFGITEENKVSYILRQAVIPVVSLLTCLEADRTFYGNFLSDSNFCAGYRNGTTACNGDSGGSLTFAENGVYRIRGIVSLTQVRPGNHNRYCKTDQYVVFTDVAKYLSWIQALVPALPSPSTVYDADEQNWEFSKIVCKVYYNEGEQRIECLDNSFTSTTNNVKIGSIEGTFMGEITYSDVNTVVINSGSTTYVPEMSDVTNVFPNFKRLFITNSNLKYVERSKLSKLSQLTILNFYGNDIETFDEDILYDLPHLEIFAFVKNQIRTLPETLIWYQLKLKELWAWENLIETIPGNFFANNKELTHIWLATNRIKKIYANVDKLWSLKLVDFRGNQCINEVACTDCDIKFNQIQEAIYRNCR